MSASVAAKASQAIANLSTGVRLELSPTAVTAVTKCPEII
jgi:hypothetical protein